MNFPDVQKFDEVKNKDTSEKLADTKLSEKASEIFHSLFANDVPGDNKYSNMVQSSEAKEDKENIDDNANKNLDFKDIYEKAKEIFNELFSTDFELQSNETDNKEKYNYDENGTRELNDEEKQELKDKLGWQDDKIDKKCRIDENGVIHYKTNCQDLEGKTSENGVPYERKTIEINGVKIEGVFPVFESAFDTELPEENYQNSSGKQFNECNKKLKEAIENDLDLKKQFTEEQLQDIENGDTPRGYTWHHNESPGHMQLVKTEDHDRTIGGAAHTGGNSLWGNKSQGTKKEGVSF